MTVGIDTDFLVAVEIREHPFHPAAEAALHRHLEAGDDFALAPQVLAEFVHVVTDSRRMPLPLAVNEALGRAEDWWNAAEVVRIFPTGESTLDFLQWVRRHSLGRKRLLDTMLAASLHHAGVRQLLTNNGNDFRIFGLFEIEEFH